jgi:methyl-accepting chemotaxis protein
LSGAYRVLHHTHDYPTTRPNLRRHGVRGWLQSGRWCHIRKPRDQLGQFGTAQVDLQDVLKQARGAEKQRAGHQQQQSQLVEKLRGGLVNLASGDFLKPLHEPFPSEYGILHRDFNRTLETLSDTLHEVISSAGSIKSGAIEISPASDGLPQRTEGQVATLKQWKATK